jgi:hypothetical protein
MPPAETAPRVTFGACVEIEKNEGIFNDVDPGMERSDERRPFRPPRSGNVDGVIEEVMSIGTVY